jgi:molecular chaperone DnaK (HSP70)/ribosomal protein L7/L12
MNTNSDNHGPIIGIDFGTTKTMVAEYDPARNFAKVRKLGRSSDEMPTSMYVTDANEVFFGDEADEEGMHDAPNHIRRFKMLLGKSTETQFGSKTAKPTDLATEFLSHLRGRLETEVFHRAVEHVVLTVPAMFGPAQRKDLTLAAEHAGFKKVELLAEPVAAGIAYCDHHTDLSNNLRFLVVDWGGGTFDLAVVERNGADECKALLEYVGGASEIGGEDLDDDFWIAVSAMIKDTGSQPLELQPKHEWGKYRRELTRAKEGLSTKNNLIMSFTLDGGKLVRIPIDRSKLEEVIHEKVHQGARQVAELVARCRKNGCVPDFILLAGGTSRIPMIAILLEQVAGLPCRTWSEGRDAIALGAAIHAHRIFESPARLPESAATQSSGTGEIFSAMSQYKSLLEGAWIVDDVITQEERVFLGKKRKELGLSIEESEIIQRQVLGALIRDIAENETTSSTNYSARKFNCPNRQCGKEMVLTPVEYASKIYACPYCKKSGSISSQQTANVAQTEHYAADGQQVMGQSGSGLEEGYYDVVLADSGRNKIAVIKALREVIPAVGLARARNIVESTPYKIVDDASSQSSEEIKRHLEEAGASVRLFRKLSIQSSEMEVASNANVICHELSVDTIKLPTPVDSSSREVSTRVSSGSLIHRNKVLKLIGRFTSGTPDDSTYVWPKLPPQKIKNAIASYAKVNSSEILLLHDSTVFGSAKDGFIMTSTHIFWKDMNEQPRSIRFSEVSTIIENASTTFIGSGLQINGIPFTPNGGFYNKSLCSMFRKLILAIRAINLGN